MMRFVICAVVVTIPGFALAQSVAPFQHRTLRPIAIKFDQIGRDVNIIQSGRTVGSVFPATPTRINGRQFLEIRQPNNMVVYVESKESIQRKRVWVFERVFAEGSPTVIRSELVVAPLDNSDHRVKYRPAQVGIEQLSNHEVAIVGKLGVPLGKKLQIVGVWQRFPSVVKSTGDELKLGLYVTSIDGKKLEEAVVFDILDVDWVSITDPPSQLPKVGEAVRATVFEGGRTLAVRVTNATPRSYTVNVPDKNPQKYSVSVPATVPNQRAQFGFYPSLFLADD